MFHAKIHRATVTQADLHYVGSVTVDQDLLDAAGILPFEQVDIYDITNGARLTTYALPGERGSGVIGINGAAAHLVKPGDLVILVAYGVFDEEEARNLKPTVVLVDERNRILGCAKDDPRARGKEEMRRLRLYLELVRFEHTLFALPFAYGGCSSRPEAGRGGRPSSSSPWPWWGRGPWPWP